MRTHIALMSLFALALPLFAQTDARLPALSKAEWEPFGYALSQDDCGSSFALRMPVRALTDDAEVRILLNVRDEANYYCACLSPSATRLIRVEGGAAIPFGHASDVGLPVQVSSDVLVRRESDRVEVFVNGSRAAWGFDDTFAGGKTAYGARAKSAAFGEVLEQPVSPIYFDDGFMRAPEDDSDWEAIRGEWRLQAMDNALRSSNGFNYQAVPGPGSRLSVVGYWFWDNYDFSVSCQPHGPGAVGVVAHYADEANYYLLTWSAAGTPAEAGAPEAGAPGVGALTLTRVRKGAREALGSAAGGYHPGQWYRLGLSVDHGRVRAFVDGALVLECWDASLPGGRAGLYADGAEPVTFDDVTVRESPVSPVWLSDLSDWSPVLGHWQGQVAERGTPMGRCRARADGAAKLLMRSRPPRDADLRAVVRARAEEAGICAGYQDERNYYTLTYSPGDAAVRIVRVTDGQSAVLASAAAPPLDPMPLELRLEDGVMSGSAGTVRIDAFDEQFPAGAAGLYLRDGQADFSEVACERTPPLPSIATYHETFSHERSMESWAEATSDWATTTAPADGAPAGQVLHWHRATVPGDNTITAELTAAATGPVTLVTGAEEPGVSRGYAFVITPGESGSAEILREGASVASASLPRLSPDAMRSVALSRRGSVIAGYLNGRPVVSYTDAAPLVGTRVAWAAPEGVTNGDSVEVASAGVLGDNFRLAPAGWSTAAGTWKVTNRWDCDPRWSFFSGAIDKGLACLWHKDQFGEDVSLEFCGATQFDGTRGTTDYSWARDINCTICADGKDLTTGYSFVFGGWDDQYTRLLRGTEVVAETTQYLVPRSSSAHRQWFYLQMEKRGPRIRCWLDGTLVFDYTDPQPLTGRRAALWTYNNGIAVARVRISSNDLEPGPFPPTAPVVPRCVYDPVVAESGDSPRPPRSHRAGTVPVFREPPAPAEGAA